LLQQRWDNLGKLGQIKINESALAQHCLHQKIQWKIENRVFCLRADFSEVLK